MLFKTTFIAAFAALAAMTAEAHVNMRFPCPRNGKYAGCPAPSPGQGDIDYDIRAPIATADDATPRFQLCKHLVPHANPTKVKAGQTLQVQFDIGAAHGGGHCQFALSYDNGKKWVVIKEVLRECLRNVNPSTYKIPVKIPSNAPSGRVVFQWVWNNAIGNREIYSTCSDLQIEGKNGGSVKGKELIIANYGRSTPRIPEFPNPSDNGMESLFTNKKRKNVTITVKGSASKSKSKSKKN